MKLKVHPLIRLSLLVLIVIVNFFVLIIMINGFSSQNQELNTIRSDRRKLEVSLVNYKLSTERKIDDDIINKENIEKLELITSNQTIKIGDLNPQNPSQGVQTTQKPLVGI